MTVYIFGGSNTAAIGGWGDGLALRLLRRVPTQNLGLAATNTLNALVRLKGDVALRPDDVVVWGNAINDAICMHHCDYPDGLFIEYLEAMIVHCRDSGARFIPVLLDSFDQVLFGAQPDYAAQVIDLLRYYDLEYLHLPEQFHAETGMTQFQRRDFNDVLHMTPHGELSEFAADLAAELIALGKGYPARKPRSHLPADTQFEVCSDFREQSQQGPFLNFGLDVTAWQPPVSIFPKQIDGYGTTIEAVTLIAAPDTGRMKMNVGAQTVPLAATHKFQGVHLGFCLTTCVPLIAGSDVSVGFGETVNIEWDESTNDIPIDSYFRADETTARRQGSEARVLSILLRRLKR